LQILPTNILFKIEQRKRTFAIFKISRKQSAHLKFDGSDTSLKTWDKGNKRMEKQVLLNNCKNELQQL